MSDDKSDLAKPRPPFVAVLVSICPPPVRAADEFTVTAISATEGYSVDTPVVIGQYPLHDAQSLTVQVRIQPAPQLVVRAPPRFADGWPEEPAAFAAALRKARLEAGLSQSRLAGLAGYSEVTIRNIETHRYAASAESRRWLIAALADARDPKTSHDEAPPRTSPTLANLEAALPDEGRKDKP